MPLNFPSRGSSFSLEIVARGPFLGSASSFSLVSSQAPWIPVLPRPQEIGSQSQGNSTVLECSQTKGHEYMYWYRQDPDRGSGWSTPPTISMVLTKEMSLLGTMSLIRRGKILPLPRACYPTTRRPFTSVPVFAQCFLATCSTQKGRCVCLEGHIGFLNVGCGFLRGCICAV